MIPCKEKYFSWKKILTKQNCNLDFWLTLSCSITHASAGIFLHSLNLVISLAFACVPPSFKGVWKKSWNYFARSHSRGFRWLLSPPPLEFLIKNYLEIFQWWSCFSIENKYSMTPNTWFGRGCIHQPYFWCTWDSVYQTDIQSSWTLQPQHQVLEVCSVFSVGGLCWEGSCWYTAMFKTWLGLEASSCGNKT